MRSVAALVLALLALRFAASAATAPPASFYALIYDSSGGSSTRAPVAAWVSADGTRVQRLPGMPLATDVSFSPDGARLAGSDATANIVVADVVGTNLRRLTSDGQPPTSASDSGEPNTVTNRSPSWSPDGARLVWEKHATKGVWELWTMRADDSGAIAIGRGREPRWSPRGSLIASYRHLSGRDEVDVADVGRGLRWAIPTRGTSTVAWSPGGTMLAFDDRDAIRLLDTATGNLRVLWDGRARSTKRDRLGLQGGLSWSPDGDRIAFGVRDDVSDPEPGGWTESWTVENAYSVGVASADVVRLTGSPPGPGIPDDLAAVPVGYWPDGSRIFFTSAALGQMNADGSCEREFPVSVQAAVWPPDVRPGLGPIKCADLAVRIEPSTEWPLRGTRRLRVTIWNDGNLDAAPRVLVSLSHGLRARRAPADCTLRDRRHLACGFPRLGPQRVSHIELVVTDSRAGRFAVRARVLPGVADPRRDNLSDETVFVSTCTRFGTSRSDTIVIRRGPAKVCAHAGDDRVTTVNRARDVVDCGPGDDTAILDRRDVAQRCEHVRRS